MKSLRNPSLVLASLTFAFAFSYQSFAGPSLPEGLGETCKARKENANELREGMRNEKVMGNCRQEAQKQYEACNLPDEASATAIQMPKPGSNTNSMVADQNSQIAGFDQTSARLTGQARKCSDARKRVAEVCGAVAKNLRDAMENNSREQRRETDEANAMQPGPQRVQRVTEIARNYGETSRQLQDQRTATLKFASTADKVLGDNARCYTDSAQQSQFNADQGRERLASINNGGSPEPGDNSAKPAQVAADQTNTNKPVDGIVTGTADAVKGEAQKAVARTTVNAVFGEASMAAMGTRVVAGAATGLVGAGTMGIGILIGSTSPAGNACSMVYTDALAADAAGCRVTTRSTIQSLGSNP